MRTCRITIEDEERTGPDIVAMGVRSSQVLKAIGQLDAFKYVDLRIQAASEGGESEMVIRCVIVGEVGLIRPTNPEFRYLCSVADEDYQWSNLMQVADNETVVATWTNSEGASEAPRSWLATREQVCEAARVFVDDGCLADVDGCRWM